MVGEQGEIRKLGGIDETSPKTMTVAELSKAVQGLKTGDRITMVLVYGGPIGNAIYSHYATGPGFKSGPLAAKSELVFTIDDNTTGVDHFGIRSGTHPIRNTQLVSVQRVQES